jgi:hypothetical protein
MFITTSCILAAGESSPALTALLARLAARGFGSQSAGTLHEALELLKAFNFDVVLASERFSDGRGYDLAEPVVRHCRSLLVAVKLSKSCLWLPVIDHGANVLGTRALSARMLETELDFLLGSHALADSRPAFRPAPFAHGRSTPNRKVVPRRKSIATTA